MALDTVIVRGIDPEVKTALRVEAAKNNLPMSGFVRKIIMEVLNGDRPLMDETQRESLREDGA